MTQGLHYCLTSMELCQVTVAGTRTDVSALVLPEELLCCQYNSDGFILIGSITLELNGYIPAFENPALIFNIENAFSNESLTTAAKSRLETMRFFLVMIKHILT